ncbi:BQ2448_3038 [Microbotryum intermedium]|uniref:BQ2448_3038 protein n=1 Tax=Microbotryum intermedium TaxID=269621 RepID=A0A238FC88_9BASI|nr:BQ2448_3038 [Microbotryum intermedium]
MVPGTASLKSMREVQRQRSLGLHAQARFRHGSFGHPGSTTTTTTDGNGPLNAPGSAVPRRSLHGLHHGTKPSNDYKVRGNARSQAALQDEVMIAHGHVGASGSMMSSSPPPSGAATNTEGALVTTGLHDAEDDQGAAVKRVTSFRVDQVMVHKPPRRDLTHDYEVIQPHARVITLPEDVMTSPGTSALSIGGGGGPSSFLHPPRQGSDAGNSSASEEDEDWELLGMDDKVAAGPRVQPQARTWASIVSRV